MHSSCVAKCANPMAMEFTVCKILNSAHWISCLLGNGCLYDSFHNPPIRRDSTTLYHIPHKTDERHGCGILSRFSEMQETPLKIKTDRHAKTIRVCTQVPSMELSPLYWLRQKM